MELASKPKKSEGETAAQDDQYDPDAWEYSVTPVAPSEAKLPAKIPGSQLK